MNKTAVIIPFNPVERQRAEVERLQDALKAACLDLDAKVRLGTWHAKDAGKVWKAYVDFHVAFVGRAPE